MNINNIILENKMRMQMKLNLHEDNIQYNKNNINDRIMEHGNTIKYNKYK